MGASGAVGVPASPPWPESIGKTLGVLGFGHIRQALARRACAIQRQAPVELPTGLSFLGGIEDLDHVVTLAGLLATALPLSPAARNLIDDRRLRLMKPTAGLVNVARAEICDEAVLHRALASGQLANAAFDIWYRYPTEAEPTLQGAQPFHELGNVIMTPHISGWTESMLNTQAVLIACASKGRHEVSHR
jgi:phosphoglycerate dehydrogenase-like enzyme